MPAFPTTGVDRYCDRCFRNLIEIDEEGNMKIANSTVMTTRATFGEHGPLEILVTDVWCSTCYPDGKTNE